MPLPRVRLTVRGLAIAAAIATIPAVSARMVIDHRREECRRRAGLFAAREREARERELSYREESREHLDRARSRARFAARNISFLRSTKNRSYCIPMPGTVGTSIGEDLSLTISLSIQSAVWEEGEADDCRARATAEAKEAARYSRLSRECERAADRPWLPIPH